MEHSSALGSRKEIGAISSVSCIRYSGLHLSQKGNINQGNAGDNNSYSAGNFEWKGSHQVL
jgi:hypothetical protein